MRTVLALGIAATTLFLTACTKKESESGSSSKVPASDAASDDAGGEAEAGTEADSDGGTDGAADGNQPGTLAILSDSQLVATMSSALISAAEAEDDKGSTLNPGIVAISIALTTTETCKNSGSPNVADDVILPGGQLAALAAYCDLAKRPDGPDTTLGGIDRVQGILCAIGNIEYDGKAHDGDMKISTDCFSENFVDMVKEQLCTSETACPGGIPVLKHIVTGTKVAEAEVKAGGYDRSLKIEVPEGKEGFAYDIKLLQTKDLLAAAVYEPNGGIEDAMVFAVSLSTATPAAIRYEGRFIRTDEDKADQNWRRHLRVMATGTYDAAKSQFTAIDSVQYLFSDIFPSGGFRLKSVKGSPAAGFRSIEIDGSDPFDLANYAVTSYNSLCYGTGNCSGNDGLVVKAETDFAFLKTVVPEDAAYVEFGTWFKEKGPLTYTEVTFAASQD
jgi:hypothetical protein